MKQSLFAKPHLLLTFLLLLSNNIHAENNEKVTSFDLILKQAPLVATLQQLAQQQNINLVVDDSLQGSVSLHLKQTDFQQSLNAIVKIHQLKVEKIAGNYFISSEITNEKMIPTTISASNNGAPNSQNPFSVTALEPQLQTIKIPLHHAKASDVMQSLTSGNGSLLSPMGSITFDDRSNSLILQEQRNAIGNLRQIIQQLDQPTQQVLIEARIVTISDESLRELGVRWGLFQPSEQTYRVAGNLDANGFNNLNNQLNVNFGSEYSNAASVSLQIAKINSRLLDLELTALERENNVNIIASPRLLTTNKQSASIKQGTEIPYLVNNTRNDTQSVEFRDAVLGLDVTPHISHDNTILLDLMVSQNSPGNSVAYGNNQMTTIDKQEIQTQVFARHGETIVLGGVFHDTIVDGQDKVPVLGDIPGVKHLFSKSTKRYAKRELVIFVTPHIVSPQTTHLPTASTLKNRQNTNNVKPIVKNPAKPFVYGF